MSSFRNPWHRKGVNEMQDSELESRSTSSVMHLASSGQRSRAGEMVNLRSSQRKAGDKRPNSKYIGQQMSGLDRTQTSKGPRVASNLHRNATTSTSKSSPVVQPGTLSGQRIMASSSRRSPQSSSAPKPADASSHPEDLGTASCPSPSSSRYNRRVRADRISPRSEDDPNEDGASRAAGEGNNLDEEIRPVEAPVLSHTEKCIYKLVISRLNSEMQPLIVPAILEGGSGTTPLKTLLKKLDSICRDFVNLDPQVHQKLLRQLFYYIGAEALNNLLGNKKLCNWQSGIKIRSNIAKLEAWSLEKEMDTDVVNATLEPLIQATELLKGNKSEEDVYDLCDECECDKLTNSQVVTLLLNKPVREFAGGRKGPVANLVEDQLKRIPGRSESGRNLLLDTSFIFPDQVTFNPN